MTKGKVVGKFLVWVYVLTYDHTVTFQSDEWPARWNVRLDLARLSPWEARMSCIAHGGCGRWHATIRALRSIIAPSSKPHLALNHS